MLISKNVQATIYNFKVIKHWASSFIFIGGFLNVTVKKEPRLDRLFELLRVLQKKNYNHGCAPAAKLKWCF